MGSLNSESIGSGRGGRLQDNLILFVISLTPFLGIFEILDLLGAQVSLFGGSTWVVKIFKDLFIVASIVVGAYYGYSTRAAISRSSLLLLFPIISLSVLVSMLSMGIESLLAGFRWLLPLFFYVTLKQFQSDFYRKLGRLLLALLGVGLILQGFQLVFMSGLYGLTAGGFNLRNPGFYITPSSMAGFCMVTLYFVSLNEPLRRLRLLAVAMVALSIILTASGTGVMSLFLFLLFFYGRADRANFYAMLAGVLGGIMLLMLPVITGRTDILTSVSGRVVIFPDLNAFKIAFSNSFGVGTNTFVNLRPDFLLSGEAIIADSMVNSSVINLGLIFMLILTYEFFIRPLKYFGRESLLYFCTFVPFYMTTIIFELFPMNILLTIALSHFLHKQRERVTVLTQSPQHPLPT